MLRSQFSAIFGEKIEAFLKKTIVEIQILQNLAEFCTKNAIFFVKFFGENFKKIIASVPRRFLRGE
jgi:hypothetical protein